MKKKIAILLGGDSSEYVISEKSGTEIYKILKDSDYEPFRIRVRNNKWTCILDNDKEVELDLNTFRVPVSRGKFLSFDYAFIIIHGTPGEDGKVQAILDSHGIPYNTSGVLSSALSFNKFFCKTYLKSYDILTPECYLYKKGEDLDIDKIISVTGLPVFVKPNNGGSSFGTSKVNREEEMEHAIEIALKEDPEVIIESYVKGTELSCGLVKTSSESIVFPVTEIATKNEFFDFEAKYTEGITDEITPARVPEEVQLRCQKIASSVYDYLDCRGVVRVDFILRGNQLYFLELNSVPGMSRESIVPKQIRANRMTVIEILEKIIRDSI